MTKEETLKTIEKLSKDLNEEDALLVMRHNLTDHDLHLSMFGNWENISIVLSEPNSILEGNIGVIDEIRKVFLNTCLNICKTDNETLQTFKDALIMMESHNNTDKSMLN